MFIVFGKYKLVVLTSRGKMSPMCAQHSGY